MSVRLKDNPSSVEAAADYRERAKIWRESAAAVPDGAPQQAIYVEIAESYERLAAHYEPKIPATRNVSGGHPPTCLELDLSGPQKRWCLDCPDQSR